jgi:hypothetical protein
MKEKSVKKITLTKESISKLNGGSSSKTPLPSTFKSMGATYYTKCSGCISCNLTDFLQGSLL